jgi:putative ABC transport system substrate-binding protein
VTIEYRSAEGNPDRLPALVAELVQAKVDVIVLAGTPAIRAAQKATSTIPVVFVSLADPVTLGFVPSLARPGGNMTGLASEYEELITKQLQLLKEAIPNVSRVALLHTPRHSACHPDRGGDGGAEARSQGANPESRRGGRV